MGTGPRGGKKVREREAAAAGDAAPAAADDDDAHRQQQSESKRTRLDDAPAKPPGAGGVDPADVDRLWALSEQLCLAALPKHHTRRSVSE